MPVDLMDSETPFVMTTQHGLVFAGVALIVLVASIIYVLFGTFSPVEAKKIYKEHVELQAEYSRLFRQRETLAYHIGWAQSRGEFQEAKRLNNDLVKLDESIDKVERKMKDVSREARKFE